MKAKYYERKDRPGRFVVELFWKGKRYRRHHYDEDIPLVHIEMARQIAGAINSDIKEKKKAFDPRQWFRSPDFEFEFSKLADLWLSKKLTGYAPSVQRDMARSVDLFKAHFKKKDIREIRKADITAFADSLPAHYKPKTKHDLVSRLHVIFEYARDEEMIEKMPGFPSIEVPQSEIKWMTREWQQKTLAEIPERDRPIFLLCVTWGVRQSEARALKWDCVDFEQEIITIKRTFSGSGTNHLQEYTKTKRIRYLPFTDELRESLRMIRGIGGFVYRNQKGHPYCADISKIWNAAQEAAGVPEDKRVTLNQGTRHSFATQHLDKLELVRVVLGHTTVDTTMKKYQGVNVDKIRELKK
jgi:integrase